MMWNILSFVWSKLSNQAHKPMKSLIRVCLVVAAFAGLMICGINIFHLKDKITGLRSQMRIEAENRARAEANLTSAKADNHSLSVRLAATETELDSALEESRTLAAAGNVLK